MTEEQKMRVLQEVGYREGPTPEAAPRAENPASGTASGSGSTSASSAGPVKKQMLKGREIVRRHSGGSNQMDMAEDCDDEPELIAEMPQAPPAATSGATSSSVAGAPPEANGEREWT